MHTLEQIWKDIKYSLRPAESKPTFEGMKCTARRYTFMYLGIMSVVTIVLYRLVITIFQHHWIGTIDRMLSLMIVSFLSLCVTVGLYIYDLDNIQHKLTASLRGLLSKIRSLDPSTPGQQLVEMDLHCDDELHDIVTTLNTKSAQIQNHIDYLEKLIGYFQHEFNTPLAIAQLHIERHLKTSTQDTNISGVQEELDHMSHLVQALVSLIKTKTEHFETEHVSINQVVKKIALQLEQIHENAHISIHEQDEVYMYTNKQYIWAICRNICENALKHGSDEVSIYIQNDALIIQDNGNGIDQDTMENIRLPFWKKNPRVGKSEGFGLGLSLVKVLLEKLQRKVSVETCVPKGTRFIFTYNTQLC